jgi:Protein of unknown function (DUF1353)
MKAHPVPISCVVGTVAILLVGCSAQSTFNKTPTTGKFSGEPRMVAIAPNTFFFFQPSEGDGKRFAFTTHKHVPDVNLGKKPGRGKYREEYANWTIEPEDMITTGASVPRKLWLIRGFGAFDFTRAAIIHDWLYEAHHRYRIAVAGSQKARADKNWKAMHDYDKVVKRYEKYGLMKQNDAADIFAECINVVMSESQEILKDFANLSSGKFSDNDGSLAKANLDELKDALHNNQPSPPRLWAYHYFVSDDCVVSKSTAMWNEENSNLELYRLLSSPTVRKRAQEKGYLSPWLLARFDAVLKEAEARQGEYVEADTPALPTQHPLKTELGPSSERAR